MRLVDAEPILMRWNTEILGRKEMYDMVRNAPMVDAVPVRHGRWVVIDAEEPRRYGCSECKRLSWNMENYCGNCGARMDGEDDETDRR